MSLYQIFFFKQQKDLHHWGSSQSSWKKTLYTNIVWLFLKFGKGGGETEVKLAQMLSLEILQVSCERLFQKLGEQNVLFPREGTESGRPPWREYYLKKALKEIFSDQEHGY